jgi:hypothetical protein
MWADDPRVHLLAGKSIGAVIGASPPIDFRALSREDAVRYLLSHQRVVEAVMRLTPALPVKFGTTLPDEAAVARLLERGAPVMAARLAEFARHVQVELIVTWNMEEVLRETAAEEDVACLKSKAETQPSAATTAMRIELGKLVKASIERRRASCRERILGALRPIATDLAENALMDDRMVANLALLLPESAGEALDQRLNELDREFGERLNFRCVGPLPPYSFATVEVSTPSFDVIDGARRALSLGDSANLADIKEAYYRLIRHHHPDRAPVQLASEGVSARLTDAYRTLTRYAASLLSTAGESARAEPECRFDRVAVEDAILVAVRRQELAVSAPESMR